MPGSGLELIVGADGRRDTGPSPPSLMQWPQVEDESPGKLANKDHLENDIIIVSMV